MVDVDATDLCLVAPTPSRLYDVKFMGNLQTVVLYIFGMGYEVCNCEIRRPEGIPSSTPCISRFGHRGDDMCRIVGYCRNGNRNKQRIPDIT